MRKPTVTGPTKQPPPLKKQSTISATSNKATDRASIVSSDKGNLKVGAVKGPGGRRKNPETSQSFSVQSANKLQSDQAKDKPSNATANKKPNLEKRPSTKLGELKIGTGTGAARAGQLSKRHTEQTSDAAKLLNPTSAEPAASQSQPKQGGIPITGLKRNTTL